MTEKENYIEQVGLFYEQYGLPKMAGRILGYLISSDSDNNSFEDLQKSLKASKGSISGDRKSTRLNSSHVRISYAVFCLKKKKKKKNKNKSTKTQKKNKSYK